MNTNSRCLLPLARVFSILLAVSALSAHAATVSLSFTAPPATATNGTPVPLSVAAAIVGTPTISSVTLSFRTWAPLCTNLWNTLPMAGNPAPTTYTATIPRLPAGNVDFYATCVYVNEDGITTSTVASVTNTYTVGTTLDTSRTQGFEGSDWVNSGSPNYNLWYSNTLWTGTQARVQGTTIRTPKLNSSANCLLYQNIAGAYVMSPVCNSGVGKIYYEAGMRFYQDTGTLVLQVSTNAGSSWSDLQTNTLSGGDSVNGSTIFEITAVVGLDVPCQFRFYRPSVGTIGVAGNDARILLDNIVIAPPPSNLQLLSATNAVTPAMPVAMDAVTILCNVHDSSTNEPTINRRVTLFYTWTSTNGVTTTNSSLAMANSLAAPDQFAAVLPGLGAGTNSYYFQCLFDGYYYTNSEKLGGPYVLPVNAPIGTFQYAIMDTIKRVMQLGVSTLNFGGVATNATSNLTVSVSNSGNTDLHVTSVDCFAPFFLQTALPLTVSPNTSSNLVVTFIPTDTSSPTNTLTVYSDATATTGVNTVTLTGTGLVAETTTMLSLTGPASGPKNTSLTYTAAASNNYGHAMQYQFDWGDGQTTTWTSATSASHAWATAATFSISAQARCASDQNVTSAWYGPLSVTLTNTRILRLTGSLAFGNVVTGIQATATLHVNNDGVDTLTVTNITVSAPFSVSTNQLTVPWGVSRDVSVFFTPTDTNYHSSLLTVFSDAMVVNGTNTVPVSGTGIQSEAISTPALTGPTSGTPGQTLTNFVATAGDTYGYPIVYRFDWGNGTTSGWSSVVASGTPFPTNNLWPSPSTNQVRAQAQNATNTSFFSSWSLPLTVVIAHTRVIGLSGNLAFGLAVTNVPSAPLSLIVTNTGSGPMTVSAVNGTPGFSAAPTSFVVPAAGGTNVAVTFLPTALGPYAGLITVVSDSTSGGNTFAATGTGVVFNAVTLTGPSTGSTGDVLTFTATVTNSWTEPLEYQFGWGDGQTSTWVSASTASHTWSTASTNLVGARVHTVVSGRTNIVSAWSTQVVSTVTIFGPPVVTFNNGQPVTNGVPLPVTVTIPVPSGTTVSNVVLFYQAPLTSATNFVALSLATNSAGYWTNTLPPLHAGVLTYDLQYMRSGVQVTYPSAGYNSFAITNDLGAMRQSNFEGPWNTTNTVPYNAGNAAGWTGSEMRVVGSGIRSPSFGSGNVIQFQNTNSAFIMSPSLAAGIGTIYFDAGVRYPAANNPTAAIVVQVSTNSGASWFSVFTYTFPSPATDIHPAITLNLRVPSAMVCIYQTNAVAGTQNILLDNIIISPPPTDLTITESLHNPGYPNSKDPVRVRCLTADVDPVNAPSVNRRLSVLFHHQTDPAGVWTTSSMYSTNVNGVNLYEGVIPVHPQGTLTYYFKCDFDGYYYSNSVYAGTALANLYPSENISPAYDPDQRTPVVVGPFSVLAQYPTPVAAGTPGITNYYINMFRSDCASISLQTTPLSVTLTNTWVDDYVYQWQMDVTGITNVLWFFVENQPYSNDATAFGPAISWGCDAGGQLFTAPPLGGTASLSTTNPLQATLVYNGLLLFRFTTTNQNYLVKRAVYQTFDQWPANQNYFMQSYGSFGITIFTENLSTWGTNHFDVNATWQEEDFQSETLNMPYSNVERPTVDNRWFYQDGMAIAERKYLPRDYSSVPDVLPNQGLQLNNLSAAQGGVWNIAPQGFTEGIHNFAFRARLAQNDGLPALYTAALYNLTNGSPWTSGYRITNTISAASMSPANPSISLLFCYQPGTWPNYNYYELRLTQVSDVGPNDGELQLDIFRWNNGVNTKEVYGPITYNKTSQRLTAMPPLQLDVSWTNIPGYGVQFTGNVTRAGTTVFAWPTNTVDADPNRIQNGGVVGFLCADAEAQISALGISAGTNLDAGILMAPPFNLSNWYLGTTPYLPVCWTTNGSGSLTRPIPANPAQLAVSINRTGTTGVPTLDRLYWANQGSFGISSYTNIWYTKSFNIWDLAFVSLQYTNGVMPVVVDDLTLDPWRAYTRGFADSNSFPTVASADGVPFWNWTDTSQQYAWSQNGTPDESGWLIFEGLIVNSAANGTYASFDRTRANPNLDQGLWSPILNNGLGTLAFNAWLSAGTSVVYCVQATSSNNATYWPTIQTFTNTTANPASYQNIFVGYANMPWPGRIRIKVLNTSDSNAVLNINNLVAYDYPAPNDITWQAYNCLIAEPSTNNFTLSRAWEPAVSNHQSCYLNNSVSSNVLVIQNADNPYVQTPRVSTGIGEVRFDCRAWDNTAAANVSIQVAPDVNGPWTVYTNIQVTSLTWTNYDFPAVFDTDDHVMRIYVTNTIPSATTGRLCIDNILMAEPVRAGYEITKVTLLPAQPLMTDQAGVLVKIGRPLMNPQGIHVFLSYVVGTNTWGLNNWWGTGSTPNPGVFTLELSNTAVNTYASMGTNFIPAYPVDSVIQFVVWGTNANMVGRPYFQGTNAFTNPSWYFPVDLNPKDINHNYLAPTNWSPYYYVYSCPPGSVWVNEINYPYYQPDYDIGSYLELVGPANAKIGNWTIDLLDSNPSLVDTCVIANGFTLTNTSNSGWGFFVWGDAGVPNVTQTFTGPPNSMPVPGAVRLVRSMGAWEDRVCWDMDLDGYTSAGFKNWFIYGAPLDLEGGPGSNKFDFAWNQPSSGNYTPGLPNTDQEFGDAPVVPLTQYYTLTSLIGSYGSASFLGAVQIASDAGTSIVYTASDWYRVSAITTNGHGVANFVSLANRCVTVDVDHVQGNITFVGSFGMLPDAQNGQNVPTSWLQKWGHPEGQSYPANTINSLAATVPQQYLLDIDPFIPESAAFQVNSIAVSHGTNVAVTVGLQVNAANQTDILGTLKLVSKAALSDANWTDRADTLVTGNVFTNGVHTYNFVDTVSNRFYKAIVQ